MGMKKSMDLLLAPTEIIKHLNYHYQKRRTEDEFLDDFVKSLEVLFDILENLIEEKKNEY